MKSSDEVKDVRVKPEEDGSPLLGLAQSSASRAGLEKEYQIDAFDISIVAIISDAAPFHFIGSKVRFLPA